MIIGNIDKIKGRSNKNKSIIIVADTTTYADAHCLGNAFGWANQFTTFTGDQLELDHKIKKGIYYFKIYEKDGKGYKLDTKKSLYIDYTANPNGDIDYSEEVTKAEYHTLQRQKIVAARNRKINGVLSS